MNNQNQVPYNRALGASVAFWLRQAADELDNSGRHFTCPGGDCFDAGDVIFEVLGLSIGQAESTRP